MNLENSYQPHQSSRGKTSHSNNNNNSYLDCSENTNSVETKKLRSITQRRCRHHHINNNKQAGGLLSGMDSSSSSSQASETVVESSWPSKYKQRNWVDDNDSPSATDSQQREVNGRCNNDTHDDTSIGVNRYNYSAESIRRILDKQEEANAALCQQLSSDGGIIEHNNVNYSGEMVNVCGVSEELDNSLTSSKVTSTFAGAAGFFTRWMEMQRIKRQRETLEKAVEEQRKILIQQSLSQIRHRRRRAKRGQENMYGVYVDEGLDGNETYQNVTSEARTILPFCGAYLDDDDEYSYGDENRENFELQRNTALNECNSCLIDDDIDGLSYDNLSLDKRNGVFMIGNACHSVSGQGVAVQLEMLDKPKHVDSSFDSNYQINIQKEQNAIPFLLSPDQMKQICQLGLPSSIMFSKWKRLYCLQRDGDSFVNSFLRRVHGQTRTLLVIQTTNHEIMGGYSHSPWESQGGSIGAAFYGSCQASLFKIDKKSNEVLVYNWTGHNRYVQVCDVQAKLLAFGGGGEDASFGLCVEDDFTVGTTGRCETFNNDPLCDGGRFEILNVECWGFVAAF